jgi:formate-dependent nitrite reductase membrane component NrfD
MVTCFKHAPGRFSSVLALISFVIGTLLLLMHLLFPKVIQIIIIGYLYVAETILINGCTLLYLLYQFALYRFHRETIAIKILILLSNIPIALLYLNIVIHNN